jgi:hypothetical protein
MCASPLRFFRAGPPPPNVALLSDALFFTRSVPITAGASAAEAATQIELAIEAVSPFPLAQLYYGWFWKPGAENALLFAAYRRRFTTEQTAEWSGAELVLPSFAAVLGAEDIQPATTIVLDAPEGFTAVHWEASSVPSKVIFRPVPPEATEEDRAKIRDDLLRGIGGSKAVLDLPAPLAADPATSDSEIVFRSGEFVSHLPTTLVGALDVRDKAELASLRGARRRDVVLWRLALGCAAALVLLTIGEFALAGGRAWHRVRLAQYNAQKPLVDKIESVDNLTQRINELATNRLLPLEMVTELVGTNLERKPEEITFTRVHAEQGRGLHTVVVQGWASNPAQVTAYETTLRNLPTCQDAHAQFENVTGARAVFTLTVTFKPGVLKPIGASVASTK